MGHKLSCSPWNLPSSLPMLPCKFKITCIEFCHSPTPQFSFSFFFLICLGKTLEIRDSFVLVSHLPGSALPAHSQLSVLTYMTTCLLVISASLLWKTAACFTVTGSGQPFFQSYFGFSFSPCTFFGGSTQRTPNLSGARTLKPPPPGFAIPKPTWIKCHPFWWCIHSSHHVFTEASPKLDFTTRTWGHKMTDTSPDGKQLRVQWGRQTNRHV